MTLSPYELDFIVQVQQIKKGQHNHEVARDISGALRVLSYWYAGQDQPEIADLILMMAHEVRRLGHGGFDFADMPTPYTDEIEWWFGEDLAG